MEQFLTERETDPEKMLKSLGFGFNPDEDISYGRIPDRFLLNPSSAGGIDLYEFVLHHPDLHHLLWIWEKQGGAQSVSSYSNQSTGRKTGQYTSPDTFGEGQDVDPENDKPWDDKQNLENKFKDMNVPDDIAVKLLECVPERYLKKFYERLIADDTMLTSLSNGREISHEQKVNEQTEAVGVTGGQDKNKVTGTSGSDTVVTVSLARNAGKPTTSTDSVLSGQKPPSPEKVKSEQRPDLLTVPESEITDIKSLGSWSSSSDDSVQEFYNVELDENETLV